jgi:hypothetical protein
LPSQTSIFRPALAARQTLPVGSCPNVPTVYSSLDPRKALDEVLAHFRHYRVPIESAMPRVSFSVRVRLDHVLDLNHGPTRSTSGGASHRLPAAIQRIRDHRVVSFGIMYITRLVES